LWWVDNSDDEDGFELWKKNGITGNYYLYKDLLPNKTGFNDKVTNGITYYYKVRAYRNPTNSEFSNEVNTESVGSKYPVPTNLTYTIVNSNQVKLNWTNNGTNELQIIVERKLQSGIEFNEIKRLPPGTTTYTDSDGLTNNFTVFYRLKTKYPQGESEYSTELTVYIP